MTANWLQELRGEAERRLAEADPRLFDAVVQAHRARVPRFSEPLVVFTEDDPARDPSQAPVVPPGSVTIFWAPRGSGDLRALHTGFVSNDFTEISEIWPSLLNSHRERPVASIEEAVSSLLGAPSFFELRYHSKTLAGYLWL